jgi:hypothetical protein
LYVFLISPIKFSFITLMMFYEEQVQ